MQSRVLLRVLAERASFNSTIKFVFAIQLEACLGLGYTGPKLACSMGTCCMNVKDFHSQALAFSLFEALPLKCEISLNILACSIMAGGYF